MGCTHCVKKDRFGFKSFKRFESSLGFNKIDAAVFHERISQNANCDKRIPKQNVKQIWNEFSLDFNTHSEFWQQFQDEDSEESLKSQLLSTAVIILSSRIPTVKLQLLWKNYSNNLSNTLSNASLQSLITDIFQIFLEFVSNYIKSSENQDPQVKDTCFKLLLAKPLLTKDCFELLLDKNKTEFNEDEFFQLFSSVNANKWLSPSGLRQFAFEYERKIELHEEGFEFQVREGCNGDWKEESGKQCLDSEQIVLEDEEKGRKLAEDKTLIENEAELSSRVNFGKLEGGSLGFRLCQTENRRLLEVEERMLGFVELNMSKSENRSGLGVKKNVDSINRPSKGARYN